MIMGDMRPSPHRYPFLDVLRGFALVGILFVNIPDMTRLGVDAPGVMPDSLIRTALDFLVATRFVPIFAFLFGMSLAFVRDGAVRRARRPWVVLLRRLAALALAGLLHQLIYPGEVLLIYAIVGLLLLPLVLWNRPHLHLWAGIVLTVVVYSVMGGGALSVPGLFLLGAGAVGVGWPERLEAGDRRVAVVSAVALVASATAVLWQTTQPGDPRFTTAGGVAGGLMAVLYVCCLSLLWQTPARTVLRALFEPLGRAAFTCYLTASLIVVPVGHWLGFTRSYDLAPAVILAGCVLAAQSLVMRWWLNHHAYAPAEWAWRAFTWWERPRRADVPVGGPGRSTPTAALS